MATDSSSSTSSDWATHTYSVKTAAPPEAVWATLTTPEHFAVWSVSFSEGSYQEGTWAVGEEVQFLCKARGGTVAKVETCDKPNLVSVKHVATVTAEGDRQVEGPMADKWLGTTETYTIRAVDGSSELEVKIFCHTAFVEMFDGGWPGALEGIKKVAEGLATE